MPARSFLSALAAVLALAACGGEDRGRPASESVFAEPSERCAADDALVLAPITNFDSAVSSGLVTCSDGDFDCDFYFNYDVVHSPARADGALLKGSDCQLEIREGALVVAPPTGARLVKEETTRCDQPQAAFHFVAENLAMCKGSNGRRGWGGAEEIDFKDRPGGNPQALDASAFDGFSFWVKKGAGTSERSIIVLAVDLYTAGQKNIVNAITGEPTACYGGEPIISDVPDVDFEKCDPFAMGVTLEDDWTFVAIRFDEMRQKGFGMPSPEGLQTQELLRLQFLVTAGDWDFWLDDVAFFRDPSGELE
jgi:hypothetical protein